MKLESFVIRQAIADGDYYAAARALLDHFNIHLDDVAMSFVVDTDCCYGLRVWVGSAPYEWFDGEFYFLSTAKIEYKNIKTLNVKVWLKDEEMT